MSVYIRDTKISAFEVKLEMYFTTQEKASRVHLVALPCYASRPLSLVKAIFSRDSSSRRKCKAAAGDHSLSFCSYDCKVIGITLIYKWQPGHVATLTARDGKKESILPGSQQEPGILSLNKEGRVNTRRQVAL